MNQRIEEFDRQKKILASENKNPREWNFEEREKGEREREGRLILGFSGCSITRYWFLS